MALIQPEPFVAFQGAARVGRDWRDDHVNDADVDRDSDVL